ncbi:hypothetical protein [Idiomarina ramblicola]|uniref:Uncharacterized protein n=1 Tax=Idiomarina ramblicola TaxID=263724 RepID=A0A432Z188_9GAMM|nr:hypothetical protein [Idiomarina ramblicola]RUO71654.1 hypothetical protein CWI78_03830 [Idiomarina ramblicola]
MTLTEILAAYAAFLSTVVFFWNVLKATPKLKVDLMHGLEEKGDTHNFGVYITVRNPSSQTVHLAGLDLLYQYEEPSILRRLRHIYRYKNWPSSIGWIHCSLSLYDIDDKCPLSLNAGQSHMVFVPENVIENMLAKGIGSKLRAKAQDQLWRSKYSKPLKYHITCN